MTTPPTPTPVAILADDERIHVVAEVDTGLAPDSLSVSALCYRLGKAMGDGMVSGFQTAANTIETTGHVVEHKGNALEVGNDD